jgi:hypothetical protein
MSVEKRDVYLTNKAELLKAMQVANSIEGAQYLRDGVRSIVSRSRHINSSPELQKVGADVVKAVDEFAKFIEFKFTASNDPWAGEKPKSSLANMQEGIAQEALGKLDQQNFRFDFAISKDGHFVRGYAPPEGGQPLTSETIDSLDRLFNAWLADKYQIITEDGFLFEPDPATGKPVRCSVERVEEIMGNSAEDFSEYLLKNNIGLFSRHREYPGEHRLEQALKEKAEKQMERVEENVAEEQEVVPDGVDSSAGMKGTT